MSVSVSVPLDALSNPRVAKALSELMLSLAGLEGGAESKPTRRSPRQRSSPRAAKAAKVDNRSEAERYRDFVEGLPEPSRAFLALVRKHGEVTLSEAVTALNITVPKAIGGITGSLSRWARERNVTLPFEASKNRSGERIWIWTQSSDETSQNGRRTKSRRRASRSSRTSETAASADDGSPGGSGARGTGPPADSVLSDPHYTDFVEGMSHTAREFLVLLNRQGQLTMAEALKSFGLPNPQAIGAVIRAFKKRARERNRDLPFEETRGRGGQRMWRWAGKQSTGNGTSPDRASGVRLRKKDKESPAERSA